MEIDRNGLEVLSRQACLGLLAASRLGRVVITDMALPAAFPVNYVLAGDDIVFVTSPGSKLEEATDGQVVAFEVDEIDPDSHLGWSVLVRGEAAVVTDGAELAGVHIPAGPGRGPYEDLEVIRIRSQLVSGRRLVPAGPAELPEVLVCTTCGSEALMAVSAGGRRRFVCVNCASCFSLVDTVLRRVEPTACPGCSFKAACTAALARDTFVAATEWATLVEIALPEASPA